MTPIRFLGIAALACSSLVAANTTVGFAPNRQEIGPFPSDALTVEDARQRTGRRVNLPLPDCQLPTNLVACETCA